jgi:serine/threonine-protein kinase
LTLQHSPGGDSDQTQPTDPRPRGPALLAGTAPADHAHPLLQEPPMQPTLSGEAARQREAEIDLCARGAHHTAELRATASPVRRRRAPSFRHTRTDSNMHATSLGASRRALLVVVAIAVTLALAAAAALASGTPDWPQWRQGPAHNAVNTAETTISTANAGSLSLAWSAQLSDYPGADAGGIERPPAVLAGAVYAASGDGHIGKYKLTSGALMWPSELSLGNYTLGALAAASFGDTTYLYVQRSEGQLLAYADTPSGPVLAWSQPDGSTPGMWDSPVVDTVNQVVYTADQSGHVYAFKALNGTPLWTATPPGATAFDESPALAGGLLYAEDHSGTLYAIKATNGATEWEFNTGGTMDSTPAVSGGVVYFGASYHDPLPGGSYTTHSIYYALDAATGAGKWVAYIPGPSMAVWEGTSAPVVDHGLVYIGSHCAVTALRVSTGATRWHTALTTCDPANGSWAGSPSVANGVVFVNIWRGGAEGGGYAALNERTGALLADHDLDGEDNNSWASPVISQGTLLLGGGSAHPGTLKAYTP